jgi:hypothetical protein
MGDGQQRLVGKGLLRWAVLCLIYYTYCIMMRNDYDEVMMIAFVPCMVLRYSSCAVVLACPRPAVFFTPSLSYYSTYSRKVLCQQGVDNT